MKINIKFTYFFLFNALPLLLLSGCASSQSDAEMYSQSDVPTANSVIVSTAEDSSKTIDLSIDDSSFEYGFNIIQEPNFGTLDISESSIIYVPDANYFGSDQFEYAIALGSLQSNTATVTINIASINDAPVVEDIVVTTNEDVQVSFQLNGYDVDFDTISYSIISQPDIGSIQIGDTITYTPASNWNGTDVFTYNASDGNLVSQEGLVTIYVLRSNDKPIATNKIESTAEDVPLQIDLNGYDVDDDPLTVSSMTDPQFGVLTMNSNNIVQYTPNQNWNGVDFFDYILNDGLLSSDVARVTINVSAVNDFPEFVSLNNLTVSENQQAITTIQASDIEGDSLSFSLDGADSSLFQIEATSGELTFISSSNYENPQDSDANNNYEVTVIVSDGNDQTTQQLIVTVSDLPDPETKQELITLLNQGFYSANTVQACGNINTWNTSKVTNMSAIFQNKSEFNCDISNWDVSAVENMTSMFEGATLFNQNISFWNVSSVKSMYKMFRNTENFNQNLNSWDVSHVTTMGYMFSKSYVFNQNLNGWDVSRVTDMQYMFEVAPLFNGDISTWNVSNVTNMNAMFKIATNFNQDISSWSVGQVTSCVNVTQNSGLEASNQPNFTACTP